MPEDTGSKQAETQFKPGQSGNPAGRPKGSRSKLGEAFIQALYADFEKHGVAAIVKVRKTKTHEYIKVVASLLPKEITLKDERELSDAELVHRIRQLANALDLTITGSYGADEAPGGTEAPARVQ